MAPEMQKGSSYDEKIDIWGIGCILCYLILGKVPFNGSRSNTIHMEDCELSPSHILSDLENFYQD
jgi:serine/threonine protein kinase